MADYETKKMIRMMCCDGHEVVVEEKVAMKSQTILHLIEDDCAESVIPIPNVTSSVLSNVFHYCKKHLDCPLNRVDDLKEFDDKFVDVDVNTLYDLIMAANFLDVKDLLDLICKKVADLIRGKRPEEIRQIFNIQNDFTPEEGRRDPAGERLGLRLTCTLTMKFELKSIGLYFNPLEDHLSRIVCCR